MMAGVFASVAAYEAEVRKERQLAGIAKARAEGKTWGGRKTGTRVRLTVAKEMLIRQLHVERKAVAAIARLVGLTRKTVYRAIRQQEVWSGKGHAHQGQRGDGNAHRDASGRSWRG
jgi:DNA invertase Pin-like site-specific DNA recombinase